MPTGGSERRRGEEKREASLARASHGGAAFFGSGPANMAHPPTHPPTHTHTHPSNPGGKQAGGNVVLGSRSRIILIGAGNGHCRIFLIFVVIVAQGLYICGDASTPVLIEEFDAGWVGSIYGIPCLQLIEAFAHQVQRIRFGE